MDVNSIFVLHEMSKPILAGERPAGAPPMTPGSWGCPALIVSPFLVVPSFMAYKFGSEMGLMPLGVGLAVIWCCVMAKLFREVGRRYQQHMRIMKEGQMVGGIVTGASFTKDSDGDQMLHVSYRFTDPGGTQREGKDRGQRNDLQETPANGTPVAVMYLDAQNFTLL